MNKLIGKTVMLKALEQWDITYQNEFGGTDFLRRGTRIVAKIHKAWHDYEIGWRFRGKVVGGKHNGLDVGFGGDLLTDCQ